MSLVFDINKVLPLHRQVESIVNRFKPLVSKGSFNAVQRTILDKAVSDFDAALLLLSRSMYNNAGTILRSAIESVLAFKHEASGAEGYAVLNDSNLLSFKFAFLAYCRYDSKRDKLAGGADSLNNAHIENYSQSYETDLTDVFENYLTEANQQRILEIIGCERFILTPQTINKLNEFFENFRFVMMSFDTTFQNIENKKITVLNSILDIRNCIFREYNLLSQVAHGDIVCWNRNHKITVWEPYNLIVKLILLFLHFFREDGLILTEDAEPLRKEIEEYNKIDLSRL